MHAYLFSWLGIDSLRSPCAHPEWPVTKSFPLSLSVRLSVSRPPNQPHSLPPSGAVADTAGHRRRRLQIITRPTTGRRASHCSERRRWRGGGEPGAPSSPRTAAETRRHAHLASPPAETRDTHTSHVRRRRRGDASGDGPRLGRAGAGCLRGVGGAAVS